MSPPVAQSPLSLADPDELALGLPESYLSAGRTLGSWLTTTDHKRIAILYALSVTLFFFIGGAAATMVRGCGNAASSRWRAYGIGTSALHTRPTGASRS